MEVKVVKPKAIELTILATKEEEEKKMKECVVIGQTKEEISCEGQEPMKILKGLSKKSDETKQNDSKNESKSSSASSSSSSSSLSSSSLEMMKKLENDKIPSQNKVNTKKEEEKKKENNSNFSNMKNKKTNSHVWDCGSTLYDSFELNSFKRQLDSAISASARTMSMSHLPDRRISETLSPPPPWLETETLPPPPPPRLETSSSLSSSGNKKHSNKISRSLHRFLKSVFKTKHHQSPSTPSSPVYKAAGDKERYYVVYDKSAALTTIPELAEKEVGPEINSLVRKTVSERFPPSRVVGISCA